ncbi:ATP-binding protein [Micromonospora sp. NPDC049102]|uniref:AAA family ATPase n=1 Tax=Micromonospora sp. NPDC049102 TaxID=3364265 RepID=UPI00371B6EDD
MIIPPLSPADVRDMLDLSAADAFDAYLVSGGLPLILDEWPTGASVREYLADAVRDPTSALLVSGERALAAEFPPQSQAGLVLRAIGTGERTFTLISRAAGDLPQASLNRPLGLLTQKRAVEVAVPLSTRPSRETRYAVADPYLRFWLSFLGRRLPGGTLPAEASVIGGYWTRTNDPEIDIVGADRGPVAQRICFVGSVKWQENRPFDAHDLDRLFLHRSRLPGADESVPTVAVSRSGTAVDGIHVLSPEDLLDAYRD